MADGRQRRVRRWLRRGVVVLWPLLAGLILVRLRYGGGSTDFPERIGRPLLSGDALEVVASLPTPPGNVAVSADGRVFLSMHPEGHPRVKVVELVGGEPRSFPDASWQAPRGEDAGGKPLPFFDAVGLDYVYCSPYRLPIARLAAARCRLKMDRAAEAA